MLVGKRLRCDAVGLMEPRHDLRRLVAGKPLRVQVMDHGNIRNQHQPAILSLTKCFGSVTVPIMVRMQLKIPKLGVDKAGSWESQLQASCSRFHEGHATWVVARDHGATIRIIYSYSWVARHYLSGSWALCRFGSGTGERSEP